MRRDMEFLRIKFWKNKKISEIVEFGEILVEIRFLEGVWVKILIEDPKGFILEE